jgi:hypothetical protein
MGSQTEIEIDINMLATLSKQIRFQNVRNGLKTDLQEQLFSSYLKSFETA